jgi:predicted transcriptional regulator
MATAVVRTTAGAAKHPTIERKGPETMTRKTIGDQELALLQWVAERGGASVGEAAVGFGADRGLARSTVLTMMERLRKKGHLSRRKVEGVYRYTSPVSVAAVLRDVVGGFVEQTLGGSVSPFVAFLAESEEVTEDELEELEALVSRLQSKKKGTEP